MGSELTIFSLYRHRQAGFFVLLRTKRPPFPNYSETQADLANELEKSCREVLLRHVATVLRLSESEAFELIGELQDLPVGEVLLTASRGITAKVFYMHTGYGYPWIILGTASSEAAFLEELGEDEALLGLRPVGRPIVINAQCFSEDNAAF